MRKFLVKRTLLSIVILFFVTFIIYVLMRCLPASYVETMARQLSQAPGSKPYDEWLAQLNAQYGLDLDLIPGFLVQLKNLVTGNFGDSWKYTVPVLQKFNEVIWVSFIMGAISLVFELLIAVPLGIVAATKQYSVTDYTVTTVALLGMSLPTFFFATLLKLVFSVKLGWFDLVGLTGRDFNSPQPFRTDTGYGQASGAAHRNAGVHLHRLVDALRPHQHAGGAERRLHPDRPRQGPVREESDLPPRPSAIR